MAEQTKEIQKTLGENYVIITLKGKEYKLRPFNIKDTWGYWEKVGEAPQGYENAEKAPKATFSAYTYKTLFYQLYFCLKKGYPEVTEEWLAEMLPRGVYSKEWAEIGQKLNELDNFGVKALLEANSKNSKSPAQNKVAGQTS